MNVEDTKLIRLLFLIKKRPPLYFRTQVNLEFV